MALRRADALYLLDAAGHSAPPERHAPDRPAELRRLAALALRVQDDDAAGSGAGEARIAALEAPLH